MNQGLILTGPAMNFNHFVTNTYEQTYLPLLSRSTQASYQGVIAKYLEPEFARCLCAILHDTRCSNISPAWRDTDSYPTISKMSDGLSSILRAAVDAEFLIKNTMEGLRLRLDKRARHLSADHHA